MIQVAAGRGPGEIAFGHNGGVPLLDIYLGALASCSPERLARAAATPGLPRAVVAIGKCAGTLFDGVADHATAGFVAVPHGHPHPTAGANVAIFEGGHPQFDEGSFQAGRELLHFIAAHDDVLFLISGGGSACVEWPRPPFTKDDLARVNSALLRSGLPIGAINGVRRQLSDLKGGKLGALVRRRAVTLIYSDVSAGALHDVASGPTLPPPADAEAAELLEAIGCGDIAASLRALPPARAVASADVRLLADNDTLTSSAESVALRSGLRPRRLDRQLEMGVDEAARLLAREAASLEPGDVIVAGGEVTVAVHGGGMGGRCTELAARFALAAPPDVAALFGSSDGVDGSSGMAGVRIASAADGDRAAILADLSRSDTAATARRIGVPIMMRPTGNNLRDLYLLARR